MAPQQHESAVNEMKRILKPRGLAYLSVAKGSYSYVGRLKWEKILDEFRVEQRGGEGFLASDRWASVSIKQS
jgi:hypothetical protein